MENDICIEDFPLHFQNLSSVLSFALVVLILLVSLQVVHLGLAKFEHLAPVQFLEVVFLFLVVLLVEALVSFQLLQLLLRLLLVRWHVC
jgi:hypothetical protein